MMQETNNTTEEDEQWQECDRVYTAEKAGMDQVDKEFVKKTIYELSKDSHHFRNEQRKQQQSEERIHRLKHIADSLTPDQLHSLTREADCKLFALCGCRDLSQCWLCVDMDAFFAAVEELHNPSLKGRPMAVGSVAMISTANYEARKYGVRSAMPGFIALKLCPQLIFVEHHGKKYKEASEQARSVFHRFDEEFEAGSLDEAYLNITRFCQEKERAPDEVARELREAVFGKTGLTCSVGIAPNTMLAKVASNINKPNGQYEVKASEEEVENFMKSLPVGKIPGIGQVTGQTLKAFGVKYGSDLVEKRGLLSALFSESMFHFLIGSGLGIGRVSHQDQIQEGEIGRKGLSCERTFQKTESKEILLEKMRDLAEDVAQHLLKENLRGCTITLKLKSHTFEVRTRAMTLPFRIASSKEIYAHASHLLEAEMEFAPFRLIGIRISNFQHQDGERQSLITDFLANGSSSSSNRCMHMEQSTDDGESDGGFICEECGFYCCGERCLQEHKDLHFAEVLQGEENRILPIVSSSSMSLVVSRDSRKCPVHKNAKVKKVVKNQLTLEQYFKS